MFADVLKIGKEETFAQEFSKVFSNPVFTEHHWTTA